MKRLIITIIFLFMAVGLSGCNTADDQAQVAATTLPVYDLTVRLCQGTGIGVTRVVTEEISCLHDYTLRISQMRAMEKAEHVVISGAGLEDFLELSTIDSVIDASSGISLRDCHAHHDHGNENHHDDHDPHIWLSIANARKMAENICSGLCDAYPSQAERMRNNLALLNLEFDKLQGYAEEALSHISSPQLITFHDGFSYLAESFDLKILKAIEEESGSEASAKELKEIILLVQSHGLPAIFTERSGSVSAASVIQAETGVKVYALDMAMAGDSYFDAMYHNINTLKEALG